MVKNDQKTAKLNETKGNIKGRDKNRRKVMKQNGKTRIS